MAGRCLPKSINFFFIPILCAPQTITQRFCSTHSESSSTKVTVGTTGERGSMHKCPKHHIDLVSFCPACRGAVRSKRKAISSRKNGKLGGRPPKASLG